MKFLIFLETEKYISSTDKVYSKEEMSYTLMNLIQGVDYEKARKIFVRNQKVYKLTLKLFLNPIEENFIFYAREFNSPSTFKMYRNIKSIAEENMKIKTIMNEDYPRAGNINSFIIQSISKCKIFIADLSFLKSTFNHNVIYEIGLAHAFNKKTILIMHESSKNKIEKNGNISLPFDISSHNVFFYNNRSKYEKEITALLTNN